MKKFKTFIKILSRNIWKAFRKLTIFWIGSKTKLL